MNIQCVQLSSARSVNVVGLNWHSGFTQGNRPVLAICYENGKIQLMKNENDDFPIMIDANLQITCSQWNETGTILAVCGMKNALNEKEINQVMFFNAFGQHLRTLKIPGREITALSWEGKSNCRISLAVDSFIYFANIRLDYVWCYFNNTVAYLDISNQNQQSLDYNQSCVVFWDVKNNQTFSKVVDFVITMCAYGEHCVIASETHKIISKDANLIVENNFKDQAFVLNLCNSLSTTVDSKYIDIKPMFITMNSTHVIVANQSQFLLWQYHTPKSSLHGMKQKKDKRYHVDDSPSGVNEVLSDLDRISYEAPKIIPNTTKDPICCITASDKILLVARESGTIQEYVLPNVAICNRHNFPNRMSKMSINCNSTRAAIVDATGLMSTIDLNDYNEKPTDTALRVGKIERKDVWSICWAKDNPQLLAVMEKTRMYIFKNQDPEEPISSCGYICNFEDLEITAVLLDEIVNGSTSTLTTADQHILHLRVKSLRDTEELLQHVGLTEAKQFIEDNSHPRLWRLLGESSLKKLDLDTAENAFVRCTNYQGIRFIKKLRSIQNQQIQKAEIAAFFGDFDEAEKLYIDADRRDLAIGLRTTLCDWFRVIQLYRMASGISDSQMENAYREIGNHFANMKVWESAKEYYEKAHYIEGLMETFYHLEKYDELENLITKLPEKSPLLGKLGQMLATVGLTEKSVEAYKKCGDIKSAISTCVGLRQWGLALELAQKYKMPSVNALLNKHAAHLLEEGKLPEAVELQKKVSNNHCCK